jgi:TolB protein
MRQKRVAASILSLYYVTILLTCFILSPGPAHAQGDVYLSIQTGGSNLISVGISGFFLTDAAAGTERISAMAAVRSTLISDFNASGLFAVRALPDSLLAAEGGMFELWRNAGARYLVYGEPRSGGATVSVNITDLETTLSVLDQEYRIPEDRPWYTAHVIVDDLIEKLTGLRGSMASQIAYFSPYGQETNELYIMNADGRGKRRLTYTKTLNMSPNWSADGSSIVFSSLINNAWSILMVNVNTGQTQEISRWAGLNSAPAFCPSQKGMIAFTSTRDGNSEVYSCRVDGSGLKRLTNHPRIDSSPSWSPDGKLIAFTSDRITQPMIYVMESDGSHVRRLTSSVNAFEDSPCWSPRGDRIAFVILFDRDFDIATCNPDGSDTVILTAGQGSNENPRWSPDGLRIIFTSTRSGSKSLYVMNADGSNVQRLEEGVSSFSPSWSPSSNGNDIRVSVWR